MCRYDAWAIELPFVAVFVFFFFFSIYFFFFTCVRCTVTYLCVEAFLSVCNLSTHLRTLRESTYELK